MIKILHLSDIHMGSGFSHGKINPETGLNTRLEDFIRTLSKCIDRAITEPVDLVLFGGDAFPDSTPAPYVQEAFAKQFKRLADAQIPTVLLVGNHDQHSQGNGGASLSIYRTLDVPGFIVGDRIRTHCINTARGNVQVITIPWLTTSVLLTREETRGLTACEIDQLLILRLQEVLEGELRRLQPDIPTVVLAHLMVDRATIGAERHLAVSKISTVPLALFVRPEIDYVALGHVHKHQNLNPSNQPPVVYPGSIERVDFSEEKEEKGYVLVELSKKETQWRFCPVEVRSFRTIKVDVSQATNPQEKLFKEIAKHPIKDAVVRLVYQLRPEQVQEINSSKIAEALQTAHNFTISSEIVSSSTPRIPGFSLGNSFDAIEALTKYIEQHKHLQDIAEEMITAARNLHEED